jgi:hypothetical protein
VNQSNNEFVDYFEVLQLTPEAEPAAVEKAFQSMARPYEKNQDAGSREAFQELFTAYRVLSDPGLRFAYEAEYRANTNTPGIEAHPAAASPPARETLDHDSSTLNRTDGADSGHISVAAARGRQVANRAETQFGVRLDHEIGAEGVQDSKNVRLRMLASLYAKRVNDFDHPGMTILEIERQSGCPRERLYVASWYLREKGFIEPDNSRYMVTVDGMDEYETIIAANAAGDKAAAEVLDNAITDNETMPANRADNESLRSLQGLSGAVVSSKPVLVGQDHGQTN